MPKPWRSLSLVGKHHLAHHHDMRFTPHRANLHHARGHDVVRAEKYPRSSQHRKPAGGAPPPPAAAAASTATTTLQAAAAPKPQPAMLLGEEVAAQRSCRAAVDLVLATPPEALSFAAFDVALNMLMVQGSPTNPEDNAAAQRLAAYAWERVGALQRWPLVRLLKVGVRYRLVTPQQLRAWQDSLAAAGGVRSLSPIQATDVLEAVRLLTLTEPGRQIAAELDPKLLPAVLNWIFDAEGSQKPAGDESTGATGESTGFGGDSIAQQGDSGCSTDGKGAAAPAGPRRPPVAGAAAGVAAAETRTAGSSSVAPLAAAPAAAAEAAGDSHVAAYASADQMAFSALGAPSQEGGAGPGRRRQGALLGVAKMPLRRLALLYHAVDTLGLRLAPAQQWRLAVAVGARLQHGEFDEGRVLLVLRVWSGMQSEYMAARFTRGTIDRAPGYPSTWVMEAVCQKVHVHRDAMGAWGLAQFFGSLGYLSFSPRVQILADLVAALQDKLQPGHAREVTAALTGLAKLGVDPGEEFCSACMAVVEADGGRDQLLLVQTAWALGVAKRLTPERWLLLLSLRRNEDEGAAAHEPRRQGGLANCQQTQARIWLFAYLLAREQAGATTQLSRRRGQQQSPPQQNATEDGGSDSGGSDSGVKRGSAQNILEPLPGSVLRVGVETALALTQARETQTWQNVREDLAEVVQQMCQGRHTVRQLWRVYDRETGTPLLVDVAVPSLRLAFQITRRSEFTHNTNTASATVLTRNRLLADWGWTLVTLPTVGYLTDVAVQKQRRWQQRAQQAGQAQQEEQQAEQPQQGSDGENGLVTDSDKTPPGGDVKAAGVVVQQHAGEDAFQLASSDEDEDPGLGGSGRDEDRAREKGISEAARAEINLRPAIGGYLIRQPGLQERLQQPPAKRQQLQRGPNRGRRGGPARPSGQGRGRRQGEQQQQQEGR